MGARTTAPITIIGAGIGGLALGLCLKHKGIPAIIYDLASSPRRYSYGIVLRAAAYRPLLSMLRMDEATLRARTAVDGQQQVAAAGGAASSESLRCHRGRFEEVLRQDLNIIRDKQLKYVNLDPVSRDIIAMFEDGTGVETECLIGCDGPHSTTRQSLSSALKLQVLPYIVFRGTRRVPLNDFNLSIRSYLGDDASTSTLIGDVRLKLSLDEIDGTNVSIDYTYSRAARGSDDTLHRPNRSKAEAIDTPAEFFNELARLPELPPPFNEIFKVEEVQSDRLLHWLMRIVPPDLAEANRLAESGVVLIGDAMHATPILGGEGANVAIQDSIELAEHIASRGTKDLKAYSEARFESWKKAVDDSQRRIAEMHTRQRSHI